MVFLGHDWTEGEEVWFWGLMRRRRETHTYIYICMYVCMYILGFGVLKRWLEKDRHIYSIDVSTRVCKVLLSLSLSRVCVCVSLYSQAKEVFRMDVANQVTAVC